MDELPIEQQLPSGPEYPMDEPPIDWLVDDPTTKPLVIVPRDEWGAPALPDFIDPVATHLNHPVEHVIFTYTETERCMSAEDCKKAMKDLTESYKAKGVYDVPYNFVVGGDGTVYEGRGWRRKPEVNKYYPHLLGDSIEIAHFGEIGLPPPPDQLNGSWDLVLKGVEQKFIRPTPGRHSIFFKPVKLSNVLPD